MKNQLLLFATVALAACAPASARQTPVQPVPVVTDVMADAVSSIRPQDFYARIGFLASDALGGRDTPSPGLEAAAAYIASEFHRAGLTPAGDPGSYIQRWPYTTRAMDVAGVTFRYSAAGASRTLSYRSDFYAQPGARGTFDGGLVFVSGEDPGPGARVNRLRDRAAVIYRVAPPAPQDLARLRSGADSAGARALVVILGPAADAQAIAGAAAAAERPRGVGSIPVFFLREERGRDLFRAAGLDFGALTRAGAAPAQVPFAGVNASLAAAMTEVVHQVPNVVGILEGSDPDLRETYVVFSAHFDHVGSNCRGITAQNTVCNGADDDASGTSAIMELAEAFAMLPVRPRRSIMFVGVSGEEKGLLGSRYFADNPSVPIESMVANINLDMIGRNHPDSVVVIGQTYSSLGPLLHEVNERHPELAMTISDDLWPEQRFFFRSDHFNFARREVPAIFFFTGVHEDYHAAGDTVDKIDLDKITRITRLIFHYASAIANDTERPVWDAAGLEEVRRLTTQGR
jgi:hypothetical protein